MMLFLELGSQKLPEYICTVFSILLQETSLLQCMHFCPQKEQRKFSTHFSTHSSGTEGTYIPGLIIFFLIQKFIFKSKKNVASATW